LLFSNLILDSYLLYIISVYIYNNLKGIQLYTNYMIGSSNQQFIKRFIMFRLKNFLKKIRNGIFTGFSYATRKVAEAGYAKAQHNLSKMYHYGKGVPQDDAEAVKWVRMAADQEYAPAQYDFGWMYANGKGVPQDYVKAAEYWNEAAEQGHVEAQYDLKFLRPYLPLTTRDSR
jgi:hypothetical protein